MRKTKAEVINETASFYNLGNRGIAEGGDKCNYYVEECDNVKLCAVGRYLKDPWSWGCEPSVRAIEPSRLEDALKEEYRGHSNAFWNDIQIFHDNRDNWTDEGLSERGEKIRDQLLRIWD